MMRIRASLPTKMLIGGMVGAANIGGWAALALGVLPTIFDGRPNPIWLLSGLVLLLSTPVGLGLANQARLGRLVVACVIAPLAAGASAGGLYALLGLLERLGGRGFPDMAPVVVSTYVATLIGTTEMITRQRVEIKGLLYAAGLALCVTLGFEAAYFLLRATTNLRSTETGWSTWVVILVYAALIGLNATYLGHRFTRQDVPIRDTTTILYICLNFLGLAGTLAVRFLVS